jgi:hypothetical protein
MANWRKYLQLIGKGTNLLNAYKISSNQYEKGQKSNKKMELLTEKER